MTRVKALILAGGQGNRLSILSERRAKPAVPFAGKYRIIDFSLSNCVNSGVYDVAVLTQYRPQSLIDHIGIGKPWDLDRREGGVRVLQPYLSTGDSEWYKGTADAVYQNLSFVDAPQVREALILSGDHVYKANYDEIIAFHRAKGADLTVAVMEVPLEEASRYGILALGSDGRVVDFEEKPAHPKSNVVSMGVYVFEKEALFSQLEDDARDAHSSHDFGRDVLPRMYKKEKVYGYRFRGYWRDVGTVQSYWEANMDLLKEPPEPDLYDPEWPIYTRSEEMPPAEFGLGAKVQRSLICNGCVVEGEVVNSVLSPGVVVERGARVEDSIIFSYTRVRRRAHIHRSILDKFVDIEADCQIGVGKDLTPNAEEPQQLGSGITLVGRRSTVPKGTKMGRNCKINPYASAADFPAAFIPSGATVGPSSS